MVSDDLKRRFIFEQFFANKLTIQVGLISEKLRLLILHLNLTP